MTAKWIKLAIATASLLTTASCASAEGDLVLVKDGKPAAVIIVPEAKDPGGATAATAAQVLVDHLYQMSGAKLEIRHAADLGTATVKDGAVSAEAGKLDGDLKSFVFVGESALSKQAGYSADGLEIGGVLEKTSGNTLGLIGSTKPQDPQTTTYAVIDCLESLGCRYLWPGESGKVIPKKSTVIVPAMDSTYAPQIKQRNIRIQGMTERPLAGLGKLGITKDDYMADLAKAQETVSPINWTSWQHLGGNIGIAGGAAGEGLRGGWDQWGKDHPEWFAQQADGTRDQSKAKDRWRLCESNPGLIEHVANDVIDRLDKDPNLTCISLCPNDGGFSSFCMCDVCKALDPPDAPKIKFFVFSKTGGADHQEIDYPALTDRMVHYWNAVAERVEKVHPKVYILVEAYSSYSLPPTHEHLNPNLVVRYVPADDKWKGWRDMGAKQLYWRPNSLIAGRKDGMAIGISTALVQQMNEMGSAGLAITDFDSILNCWAVSGFNYYAAAKLNWNTKLTLDQVLDDYSQNGFGPAAAPIKKYFQRLEEISTKQRTDLLAGGPQLAGRPRAFSADEITELRGLLDAADKAGAGDEALLGRIAFIRLGLNYSDLSSTLTRLAIDAQGKTGDDLAADKKQALPLLALHSLILRDIVKNHNLAIWTPYIVWASNEFTGWKPIDGSSYQPDAQSLALLDVAGHTMTGHEKSIDDLYASFGIDKDAVIARGPTTKPAGEGKTDVDADENGKAVKVLK